MEFDSGENDAGNLMSAGAINVNSQDLSSPTSIEKTQTDSYGGIFARPECAGMRIHNIYGRRGHSQRFRARSAQKSPADQR